MSANPWAIAAMGAGMGIGGYGELKANIYNRGAKKDLKQRSSWLTDQGKPMWTQLVEGYAPGGEYRTALATPGLTDLNKQEAGAESAIRSNAWRYGGSGGGLARQMLEDQREQNALSGAAIRGTAEGKADSMLADLYRQQMWDQWELNPVETQTNTWAPYGNMLFNVGAQNVAGGGSGGAGKI